VPFNVLLLPLLGGYVFITYWNHTRFSARRYSGERLLIHAALAGVFLLVVSYAAMALAGFLVSLAFQALGISPEHRAVSVFMSPPAWNYTTSLDIAFLILLAGLAWRSVTTGGIEMLRAHSRRPEAGAKLVRDPVCGMSVDPATATEQVEYMGATYYFCSPTCRSAFEKDPARYTAQVVQVEHEGHLAHSHVTAAKPGGEMERERVAIDPVCGMSVATERAEYRSFQKGDTYYFCSAGCKQTFDKDPGKYMARQRTE